MRTYKAVMHFNKPASKAGTPWTVHLKGVCHVVRAIDCRVPMQSEWKPTRKANPRAFFTARVTSIELTPDGTAILR